MKKNLLLLAGLPALLLGAIFVFLFSTPSFQQFADTDTAAVKEKPSTPVLGEKDDDLVISYVLNFGDDKIQKELVMDPGSTVFSSLEKFVEEQDLDLKTKTYDFGVFVEGIGDYLSDSKKTWIYYVNDEVGQVAADQLELSEGDSVEWKYEKVNF